MQVSPSAVLLSLVALAVFAASLWAWLLAAIKLGLSRSAIPQPLAGFAESLLAALGCNPRLPLVAWQPRRAVPWALIDLVAILGIWIVASIGTGALLRQLGWLPAAAGNFDKLTLDQRMTLTLANALISLAILGVGLPLVALRSGATWRDLGWSPGALLADIRLGLIGFVMLAPPTYALQGVLVYFWQPSKHPLLEMFKGTPNTWFFAVLFVSAAVVAPLLEECIFRVILQGFLEKAFSFRGNVEELLFGSTAGRGSDALPRIGSPVDVVANHAGDAAPLPDAQIANPYRSPADPSAADHGSPAAPNEPGGDEKKVQEELCGLTAWLPIAVSSAVFALLHYAHGPDWIPLLFLAGGMGYLYQRTHRLLPSLVVHATLNSLSMWGLWVQVGMAAGNG